MRSSDKLITAVSTFADDFARISDDEDALIGLRNDFVENVEAVTGQSVRGTGDNPLTTAGVAIDRGLTSMIARWAEDWDATKVTQEFSDHFSDKIIFLVFGKVNAGKSAFGNFIASTFPPDQVRYFFLQDGRVQYTNEPFKEGTVETTARIQGVELGGKLVLLDSPGLHSVTEENGDLTRRFTDSADAVLWLTPSLSPGQTLELNDLSRELQSGKPLLPIITRSDFPDDDEENGEIVTTLVNKSRTNRQAQEEDVLKRAQAKLKGETEVRQPISISVFAFQKSGRREQDFEESGLAATFDAMASLATDAAVYKPRKARQQIVNYLDQSVLETIQTTLVPQLDDFEALIEEESASLGKRRQEILSRLRQELTDRVTDWAEELKQNKDRSALAQRINELVVQRLTVELQQTIEKFAGEARQIIVKIDEKDIGEFQDVNIEYQQITGKAMQATASSALAVAGGAIGFYFGGPWGSALGGYLGGLLGDAGGSLLVETERVTETVGVDATKAVEQTLEKLDRKLPKIIDRAMAPWDETLDEMKGRAAAIRKQIRSFNNNLDRVRKEFNDESN